VVAIGDSEFHTEGFKLTQSGFTQKALEVRIGVATKNSATGETIVVNGALAVNIVRAPTRLHRFNVSGIEIGGQIH
jgi:hypothetical protein